MNLPAVIRDYLGDKATFSVRPEVGQIVTFGGATVKYTVLQGDYEAAADGARIRFSPPYPSFVTKALGFFKVSGPINEVTLTQDSLVARSGKLTRRFKITEVAE